MTVALMFLTGVLARAAVSNTLKAASAAVAWMLPKKRRRAMAASEDARKLRPAHQRTRFSHPKRRHPHQVMRAEDLEVGREYVSVHVRKCDGRMFEYRRTFAGTFSQEAETTAPPGVPRLSSHSHYENYTFTLHPNGYTLWGGDGKINSYSSVAYLLGQDAEGWTWEDQHQLLVPADQWDGDPHVFTEWEEERPKGEAGERVWMYDRINKEQLAGIIDAPPTRVVEDPWYYVTFIRGTEFARQGSCTLIRRSDLTVRCTEDELVDELCAKG